MASGLVVYSVGYQGKSLDELCQVLRRNGIEVLLDVRERAWSNRPEFRKTALSSRLKRGGIGYDHLKPAGNPFRPRGGQVLSTAECFSLYTRHLERSPEVIDLTISAVQKARVALFCYEASATDCHRGVLVAAMLKRDPSLKVVHL